MSFCSVVNMCVLLDALIFKHFFFLNSQTLILPLLRIGSRDTVWKMVHVFQHLVDGICARAGALVKCKIHSLNEQVGNVGALSLLKGCTLLAECSLMIDIGMILDYGMEGT